MGSVNASAGGPEATPGRQEAGRAMALTAFGAILVIIGASLLGALLDGVIDSGTGTGTGIGFVIGCVLAAAKTRRRDLVVVAVTPPLLFVVAIVVAETIRSWGAGSWFAHQLLALTTGLAADAPWLVLGTAAAVVIGLARGLLRSLSDR